MLFNTRATIPFRPSTNHQPTTNQVNGGTGAGLAGGWTHRPAAAVATPENARTAVPRRWPLGRRRRRAGLVLQTRRGDRSDLAGPPIRLATVHCDILSPDVPVPVIPLVRRSRRSETSEQFPMR